MKYKFINIHLIDFNLWIEDAKYLFNINIENKKEFKEYYLNYD